MAENEIKEFLCDNCDAFYSYNHAWPPLRKWFIDLEKYIVLCPECANPNEKNDLNRWIQNIRAAANSVKRKAPPL